MDDTELRRRYTYHAPDEATRDLHDRVREYEFQFASTINAMLPGESREKSVVLTKLEEAMFWAHAHIARNVHKYIPNRAPEDIDDPVNDKAVCIVCGLDETIGAHV